MPLIATPVTLRSTFSFYVGDRSPERIPFRDGRTNPRWRLEKRRSPIMGASAKSQDSVRQSFCAALGPGGRHR